MKYKWIARVSMFVFAFNGGVVYMALVWGVANISFLLSLSYPCLCLPY